MVPPMPALSAVVPYILAAPIQGTRYYPNPWEGATTLCTLGLTTSTRTVHRVLAPEWWAMHLPCGSGSSSARSCRHNRLARARGRIIPKTPLDFHNLARLLVEPYPKIGSVVLCGRITSSVIVDFLNKVILLLPQHMNIAQGQMVVACREPLVLKMPWFLPEANFEIALNFNKIFCMNV